MAFRLKAEESPDRGTRRVVKAQLEKAIEALAEPLQACSEERIHRARKCFKRIRAVLKLVRLGLPKEKYREENERYRDLGRALSPIRDVAALKEAFCALITRYGDQGQPHEFDTVHDALEDREQSITATILRDESHMHKIGRILEEARANLGDWANEQIDWDVIHSGFRRLYKKARASYKIVRDEPTEPHVHEWRKRIKDLGYALELLDSRRDPLTRKLHEQVVSVGECLGLGRDFTMLRELITTSSKPDLYASAAIIVPLIDTRLRHLHREALATGKRLAQFRTREISTSLLAVVRQS